ncbi:hypothetical protein [Pseudonocardia sp. NPDC046786]|uniref:hypothetical protein n=1 Tax=Pseudonocardia sp. NPDC046786 TaxID=3155471 RepID=UPI0033CD0FFA
MYASDLASATGIADDGSQAAWKGRENAPVDVRTSIVEVDVMSAGTAPGEDGPEVLTLTSVIDRRAHKVTDTELCAPHAMRTGRYEALCGHLVSPAPLVAADGTPCRRCVELDPTPTVTTPRRRGGWLGRLLPA